MTKLRQTPRFELVTASGEKLSVVDHVSAPVQVGTVQTNHNFVVVNRLVAPVILGADFLQRNHLVLDFSQTQVEVRNSPHFSQRRETTDVDTREEWEKIIIWSSPAGESQSVRYCMLLLIRQMTLLTNAAYQDLETGVPT